MTNDPTTYGDDGFDVTQTALYRAGQLAEVDRMIELVDAGLFPGDHSIRDALTMRRATLVAAMIPPPPATITNTEETPE